MNDLGDRIRRNLHVEATELPEYPARVRTVTRRGRQRALVTRLAAAAVVLAVLGGGVATYLVLRDGGSDDVVVASGVDDQNASEPSDAEQPETEPAAGASDPDEPIDAPADDEPVASPPPSSGLEGAACLGFDVYCLGVAEQDAVAAGVKAWGEEETGPIFEGSPPGPGEHVWFPAAGAMVQVNAGADGSVAFIRLSQPVEADPVTPWEVDLPAGLRLGADTLDDVLDTLGPPTTAFYGGGEGVDVVVLDYSVGSATVTYGYIQSWGVGFLSEYEGLADAALVDAVRGRELPLRLFMAQTVGDEVEQPPAGSAPPLALRSWGDVTLLMSRSALADLAQVQPAVFSEAYTDGEGCGYVIPKIHPGVGLMITNDEVVRIDISDDSVQTLSGIGVGSTTDDVYAAYGDQIVASPHPYLGDEGQYLTFVPRDAADADYRLIFETGDDVVIALRTGVLPEVEWIEGCS